MSLSQIRVLVIDDELAIRVSLAAFLEDHGLQTRVAESGEKALALLAAEPADVAIVDIRLHGMDGHALILKAHEMMPSLKFLIFTGSADYHLPEGLARIGITMHDIFRKPLADLGVLADAALRAAEGREEPP